MLVPLLYDPTTGLESLLLTKRTEGVATHKSQVSFPGGYREPEDATLLETALRESREEVGLLPEAARVLGRLPVVTTRGEIRIAPFVAEIDLPYAFAPSEREVDRLLYLPLERLSTEGLRPVTVQVGTVSVLSEGIDVDGEMVWGATARILRLLQELLGIPLR